MRALRDRTSFSQHRTTETSNGVVIHMPEAIPIHKTQSILDQIDAIRDLITQRAYQIFQETGGLSGREMDNWMQAERELVWQPAIELTEKDNELRWEAVIAGVEPK